MSADELKIHKNPKNGPPRPDLRKIVNDSDEVKDLKKEKSKDKPESEQMFKLKKAEVTGILKNAAEWNQRENSIEVGERVVYRPTGPGNESFSTFMYVVTATYPKARNAELQAASGVKIIAHYDEIYTREDLALHVKRQTLVEALRTIPVKE